MIVSEPSGFTLLTVKNGSLSENTSHLSRFDPLFNKKQKAISIITILICGQHQITIKVGLFCSIPELKGDLVFDLTLFFRITN